LAKEASIEPTLTGGIVSAIKKSIGGWPVIQMDASISHGSSGSPVCNDRGEVIGLTTFGSLEEGGSSLVSGFNFAIPVSVVKEFMDPAVLRPKLSDASLTFNEGLDLYYQQLYSKALAKFERVKKLYNNYPQVVFYTNECSSKIARGNDRHTAPRKYVLWIMLVIAVLTGGYLLFIKRKRSLG
jgi:hypothetical protein